MAGFTTPGQVRGAVTAFRNDATWVSLKKRHEDDFNLYRLKPYDAGSGYFSYTTNVPRVYADKVIALLTTGRLNISVPLELLDEPMRQVASNIERFDYGVLNMNDTRMLNLGLPTTREQMAWYTALRGGVAINAFVYKDENGETVPEFNVWDIYNVAYAYGKNGLAWAIHTKKMSKGMVKALYGISIGEAYTDVYEYWDTESFGVVIKGKWAEALDSHGLDYCPVAIIKVGAMPTIWNQVYQYAGKHEGESIFAPIRELIPVFNKTMSDHLTVVRRGVKPPMVWFTLDGESPVSQDIYQVEKAANITLQVGEEFRAAIAPTMPADTSQLLEIISGELQRGSFPHTVYGAVGFRMSGFLVQQLHQAIQTVVVPAGQTMERAYYIGTKWLREQYASSDLAPIKVKGRNAQGRVFGAPRAISLSPEMIIGDWETEVKLEFTLPEDDAQKFLQAQSAGQGEIPLLSMRSRRELVGVTDPDMEDELVDYEWGTKLPINRLYKAFDRAVAEKDYQGAENILAELKMLLQSRQPQGAGAGSEGLSALQEEAAGLPGVGIPPGEGDMQGFPPSAIPPETQGGLPPGAGNAIPPPPQGEP